MNNDKNRVCSAEHAWALDLSLRKLVHNPRKILSPYVRPGMTVLDFGPGPGFFTLEMARMVGKTGKVIGADLQAEMLEKLRAKIRNTDLEKIITLHKTGKDEIDLNEKVDFALVFYVLHEIPNQENFLRELKTLLKPDAKILIVEPKAHVTEKEFEQALKLMKITGLKIIARPKIFFSRAIVVELKNQTFSAE